MAGVEQVVSVTVGANGFNWKLSRISYIFSSHINEVRIGKPNLVFLEDRIV